MADGRTATAERQASLRDQECAVDVLVVDDEPSVRGFIARVLTRNGFDCRAAGDAREAMSMAKQRPPTITVCDLRMPGEDGRWLLREIKRRWFDSSVIMLSAVADTRTAVECLKSGADDYLVKPVDLEELLINVRKIADRTRLVRESRESREDLAVARHRATRLQEAFHVIEDTYRDALGVFVHGPSQSKSSAESAQQEGVGASELALGLPDALQDVELAALRVAGRLIGEGSSSLEVTEAIGRELVDRGPILFARFWKARPRDVEMEAVIALGESSFSGQELARRALLSGKTECDVGSTTTTVTCPISVGSTVEGALQLGSESSRGGNMIAFAERIAPVVAASFARERESLDRARTAEELDLFYKLAAASRHSLDLEHVGEFLFGSLHRIVDYDAAGLLILEDDPYLSIRTRFPADELSASRIREQVLNTLKITCGVELGEDLKTHIEELRAPDRRPPSSSKLRSFVNCPFSVDGRVVGLIHVSSVRDRAFSDADAAFLNRAANFLASSVQGVRDLLSAVKGRVEQMVEHMTDGVLMLDRRGHVVAMNGAAHAILEPHGCDETSWNASCLGELLEFDPLGVVEEQRLGIKKVVCVRGVAYQAQLSAVTDSDGELAGAVLAFRNFDEEQRADEMKSELVNVVSHELRTPLTALRNALFLLKRPKLGLLTEDHHHFLDLAQRNVEQLIETVNDLLDLSKIEAGKLHIPLAPLAIADPLTMALSSLEAEAERKGVTLKIRVAPDLPNIHGNPTALQRIAMNLVGNALKYTDAGGAVTVDACWTADDNEGAAQSAIVVSVTDSGVGIPPDQLETVFDKFQQAQRPDGGPKVVGTGLGLSICRELVKAHHGRIWAESTEGEGSRFSFVVPVLSESELFFRTLSTELERAGEHRTPLVLLIAKILNADELMRDCRPAQLESLLEELLRSTQSVVRRSGDRVLLLRDHRQVAVILPRTERNGGLGFESRLRGAIEESEMLRTRVELGLGFALHPDDGTSRELYRAAEERATEKIKV